MSHLIEIEVVHLHLGSDIERRLVLVGDEQMRLGGIDKRLRKPPPGHIGVGGPIIKPTSEHAEDFTRKVIREEAVYLVHGDDHMALYLVHHLTNDEVLKIDV